MTRKPVLTAALGLAAIAIGFWIYRKVTHEEPSPYRFATIERGNLESAVSATGLLGAVTSVQVGTQVSGQVSDIYVDFNDKVKKGQLIARIDPTLQQQAVQTAQASLERSRAEADKAKLEYDRNQRLFENKVLTEIEFNTAKYAYAVAQANLKSAQIALTREKRNLDYTSIYSPIDGIIVERNVDVGQTVAASYSTPQLFLIAKDLSQMQILASVDESDIGVIKKDQPVRFTVQAYPNQTFEGQVKQVRLQSKTTENVVNYTVVIGVPNTTGKLLPGMTATAQFVTGSADDVLTVPNAALRFRPPEAMMAKLREEMMKRRAENGAQPPASGNPSSGAPFGGGQFGGNGAAGHTGRGSRPNAGMLWYLDEKGQPAVARVRTGISDGQKTQVEGPKIKEGMQVIIGITQAETAPGASLFSPAPQQRGPGQQRQIRF